MCFWIMKSKTFRYVRVFVLWSIIFLLGCLYVLHSKQTVKDKAFILYSRYSDVPKGKSSFPTLLEGDISNTDKNNPDYKSNARVYSNFLISRNNNITFSNSNLKSSNRTHHEIYEYNVSKFSNETFSNKDDGYPSPNPIYATSKEIGANRSHHDPPLVDIDKFTPTYQDVIKKYFSLNGIVPNKEGNQSGYSIPPHYKKFNVHWTIRHNGMVPKSLFSSPPGEYPQQRLPKAILIGAGKCGTRAIIEFLGMHPYVVPARQEVHYFDSEEHLYKGLDWYVAQMPLSYSNQMTVEKSPSYMWSYVALREIRKLNKNMKLMVILRDPVERVISQSIRTKHEDITRIFLEQDEDGQSRVKSRANTVQWSIYAKYIRWWMEAFPLEQIHIVESKELAANPAKEMQKIEQFLGVQPMIKPHNFYFNKTKGFYCMRPLHLEHEIVCLSDGKGREHPKLKTWLKKLLYDFFRPYNEELFLLLGRRFDWEYKEDKVG